MIVRGGELRIERDGLPKLRHCLVVVFLLGENVPRASCRAGLSGKEVRAFSSCFCAASVSAIAVRAVAYAIAISGASG